MNDKLKNALGNIDESLIEEAANAHSLEHTGAKITVGILASAAAVAAVAVGVNTLTQKRGVDLIDTSSGLAASAQPMSALPLWLSSVIPVNALPEDWTYEACNKAPALILADMEQSNIAVVTDWRYDSAHICRVKDNEIISLNLREAIETGLGLIKFGEYGMEYSGEYEILGGSAINYDGNSNAVFLVKCHGTSEDGCPTEADIYYRLYEDADGWKISPLADWFGITETTDGGTEAIVEPKEYPGSFDDISNRTADGAIETNGCLVSLEKIRLFPKEFETDGADNDIGLWTLNVLDRSGEYSLYPFIKYLYAGTRSTDDGTDTYYLAESYQGGRFILHSNYMSAVNGRLFSMGGRIGAAEFRADFAEQDGKLVMQAEKTIPNSFLTLPAGFEFGSPDSTEPQDVPMPEGEDNGLVKLFTESADFLGQNSITKGLLMTIENKGSSGDMVDEEAIKLYAKGANIFGLGYGELWSMTYSEMKEEFDDGSGVANIMSTDGVIIIPLELKDDILYACSPTDGTVIETTVSQSNNGALYDVIIDAGNGICMSLVVKAGADGEGGFCVSVGDEVKTGDKLLIEDGISSYSALNFGVWNNGKLLDPQCQTFNDLKVRTDFSINAYDSTMYNYLHRIMSETVSKPDGSEQPTLSYPLDLSVYDQLSYGTGHDGEGNYHGITIYTDISGTPLHAGGDGTVAAVYDKNSTGCPDFIYEEELGNYVIIDHGHGYCTLYGCMDEITVSVGDTVKEGDVIGTAGKFGDNSLYYKAYLDGNNICAFPAPRSDAANYNWDTPLVNPQEQNGN